MSEKSSNDTSKESTASNLDENIKIDFSKIPDDEYICPKCEQIPEILGIHFDNGRIKFQCKNCGIIDIYVTDYFSKFEQSENNYLNFSCAICKKKPGDKDNIFFCYDCKKKLCDSCAKDKEKHSQSHYIRKIIEKKKFCSEHYNEEIVEFCLDCKENVCREKKNSRHKDHKLISLFGINNNYNNNIDNNDNNIDNSDNNIDNNDNNINNNENLNYNHKNKDNNTIIFLMRKINEKNKEISRQIKLNELILNTCGKFPNNYYHMKSLINLGESIEKENLRDSKDIESIFEYLNTSIEESKKFRNELNKKQKGKIFLNRFDTFLHLSEKNLDVEDLKLISLIKFVQLKEINISYNNIKSIEAFKKMNLPFLEYINISHNQIENIEPIVQMNSKSLKDILLFYNKLKDISALEETEYKNLEILRVEENPLNEESLKKIKKKYKDKFIYKLYTFKDFKLKYNVNIIKKEINPNEEINPKKDINPKKEITIGLDLSDNKKGDEIIKNLYICLTINNKSSEIQILKLMNNNIKNLSFLNKIPFPKLRELDLAVNQITNLNFLTKMNSKILENLYLNDNKINNISPLIKFIEKNKNLKLLTLKNNNFNPEKNKKVKELINIIKEKNKLEQKEEDKLIIDI